MTSLECIACNFLQGKCCMRQPCLSIDLGTKRRVKYRCFPFRWRHLLRCRHRCDATNMTPPQSCRPLKNTHKFPNKYNKKPNFSNEFKFETVDQKPISCGMFMFPNRLSTILGTRWPPRTKLQTSSNLELLIRNPFRAECSCFQTCCLPS